MFQDLPIRVWETRFFWVVRLQDSTFQRCKTKFWLAKINRLGVFHHSRQCVGYPDADAVEVGRQSEVEKLN
jgi:hypothetical protein